MSQTWYEGPRNWPRSLLPRRPSGAEAKAARFEPLHGPRGRVDPLVDVGVAAQVVGPAAADGGRPADGERRARLVPRDAGDLPAAQHLAEEAAVVLEERQAVGPRADEDVRAVEVARAPVVVDVLGTVRRVVEVAAAVVVGPAERVVEREGEVPAPLAEEDLRGVVARARVAQAHLDVRVALVRPEVVRVVPRPRRVRLAVREGRQVDVRPPHQVGAVGSDVGDLAEEAPPGQLALQAHAPVPRPRDLEAGRDRLHAAPRRERGNRSRRRGSRGCRSRRTR